ncbi:MAG TPA: protein kinase, partial [Acidobacteriota bacterium]|nr:protein kinase [Acidobacteriota bacterium]
LHFIGEGGASRVYKAWDPALGRSVALKFLRIEDPRMRLRQMREAQTQARIEHPYVCKVFEVAEAEGRQYIAMQYIEGNTLSRLSASMNLEQKIRLLHQVTLAIQEAHRNGLIHRDVKPGNIMVERDATGDYVPYIMDFGLARELDAPGLTMTGIILGTPAYMSPEQARGDSKAIDRRTDVYSIGATLYEILANTLPFDGDSNMQVLHQVINDEPTAPRKRNPSIPRELEMIVLKCLDKDPDRRYESARALAEDLDRFLCGEAVLARSAGLTYRIYKRMRKHPAISAIMVLAAALVISASAYAAHTRWRTAREARFLQQFAQQAQEMDGIMRFAYLLPLHDVRPESRMVHQKLLSLEKQMKELGNIAAGPGNYALGSGWISLHDFNKARKHLELAWNHNEYHQPQVANALGLTLANLYQHELSNASRITNKTEREQRLKKISKELREPALHYIRLGKSQTSSPEFVAALIHYLEAKYDLALSSAQAALNKIPWLYEAQKLQGDTYYALGNEHRTTGDYAAAIKEYQKAETMYQTAIQSGRSDSDIYNALCNMEEDWMEIQIYQTGDSPVQRFQKALHACEDGLKADPDNAEIYTSLLWLHNVYGYYQTITSGEDARPTLEKGVTAGLKSIKLQPNIVDTHDQLGRAYSLRAEYEMSHGSDPRMWLEKASEHLKESTRLDQTSSGPYGSLSINEYLLAWYQLETGGDPRQSLRQSIESGNKAIQLNPTRKAYYRDLGAIYNLKADYELNHGIDVRPTIQTSIKTLNGALKINPNEQLAHFNMAQAYLFEASYLFTNGIDPSDHLQKAESSLKKALEINPEDDYSYLVLGGVYTVKGQYAADAGKDFNEPFKQAESYLKKALTISSERAPTFLNLGTLYAVEANILVDRGRNPSAAITKAREALQKAKSFRPPELGRVLNYLALSEYAATKWSFLQKHRTEPRAERTLEIVADAIKTNGQFPDSYLTKAKIHVLRAQMANRDANSEIENGIQAINQALSLNPQLAEAYAVQSELFRLQKKSTKADAAISRAILINPLLKQKRPN